MNFLLAEIATNSGKGCNRREPRPAAGFRELPALLFLIALISYLLIAEPKFGSSTNLLTVARETSIVGIMGAGMTMVIITAGIDLSVASVLAFSAGVMAMLVVGGASLWVSVASGLAVGTACGGLNGLLITQLRIPPIIATLGTMSILRAGVTLYTGAKWIGPLPNALYPIGTGCAPLVLLILVTLVLTLFMRGSATGRHIYAVGGNEEAVRLSGVSPAKVKLVVYLLNGLFAAVAGVIMASSMSSAQSNMAWGYELNVIAAVVIGGTSINGGRGSIFGTILGAAIMAVLSNALILQGIHPYWHKVITGAIILAAVMVDRLRFARNNEGSA